MRARLWIILLAAVLPLATPHDARAQGFADVFAGVAFTPKNDVDLTLNGVTATGESDFKDSFSVGVRGGYWWSFFGVGLDVSYFRPELDPDDATAGGVTISTDLDVWGLGVNALLRGQLIKDTDVPEGRLQPYVFGGPTLFITRFDVDLSGAASGGESDDSTRLGFTAGGGVAFMITRQIGLFGEYRFTYNRPELDISGLEIEPKLDSHHVLGGVTFRF
jgi:opacity protein-like surface antigen